MIATPSLLIEAAALVEAAARMRDNARRTWPDVQTDLAALRELEDDWDGQGAAAPPAPLIQAATLWVKRLRDEGWPAPDFAVAGVNGTVFFEWQVEDGSVELEVTSPQQAELLYCRLGELRLHAARRARP